MTLRLAATLSLLALLGTTACSPRGYVKEPGPWVADADWAQAQHLRVTLSEYRIAPQVVTFEEGRPYALEIANEGREKHAVHTSGFFRAVATRWLEIRGAAGVRAPYFTSLELMPGVTAELQFVAVRPGTYEITCPEADHAARGMVAAFEILPHSPKPPPAKTP